MTDLSRREGSTYEYRVLWSRTNDSKSGIVHATDEEDARAYAKGLHDSGLFKVCLERREHTPWQRFAQSQFPDEFVVKPWWNEETLRGRT